MLRIRLRRVGKKGRPYYRIVVTEKRNPRDGAYIDGIGHYDPMTDPPTVTLDESRAIDWLRKGAQPSDPVRQMFERNDIFSKVHPSKVDADERAD
ncbi:30S ribosomal protein S16 [Geodia barretti]|jgi:small subunit ribosomal protein S16|uniref:Small ribosomal subunit protein bS16m n=2 Tax=Geodia barretti TaxID=519541 RepID=A0AA35RK22_GEOBA|nr:30S ribosomal protein S16 [Geodia barretti]